jgi:hypothetical protein
VTFRVASATFRLLVEISADEASINAFTSEDALAAD